MPTRTVVQRAFRSLYRRVPSVLTFTHRAMDLWYQVALLPFRRRSRRGRAVEDHALIERTEAYNAAADRYFTRLEDPTYLLRKPFSDPDALPRQLIDVGVLINALHLLPGDVVLEIGAGSCWFSHFLNRFGCRTIAVDVSPTVIALGKQLFERDSNTNWALGPTFLAYDGHRLPVDDQSCDYIVLNDAFHHIPNQRELLKEMHRVLRPDGVVGMSEPGQGHASAEDSLLEVRRSGVLENELVLEDVAALARDCGFAHVSVIVSASLSGVEIPAEQLGPFMGGKGFAAYWQTVSGALEGHHHILCYKRQPTITTRRPRGLVAAIEVLSGVPVRAAAGRVFEIRLRVTNCGDTTWLGGVTPVAGWTRLGGHLYGRGTEDLIDFDWWRTVLPSDVAPDESVELDVQLPVLTAPGEYVLVLDMVVEGLTWFAGRGSHPATVIVLVS
jgi:SAM-dependent methyltransferase